MSKKPKTGGLEWLIFSLMAFNGSGYADMNSADDFIDSYMAYKAMYRKSEAVMLARQYREEVLPMVEDLLEKTYGSGRHPAQAKLDKFQAFRQVYQSTLF